MPDRPPDSYELRGIGGMVFRLQFHPLAEPIGEPRWLCPWYTEKCWDAVMDGLGVDRGGWDA